MLWSFETGHSVEASPTVVDDVVYVASKDCNVYALNAITGKKIWNFTTGYAYYGIYSCPVVINGMVYIGSNDNYIYALDAETGAQKWSYDTHYFVWSSPAYVNGVL
jgi:eukaryotic-like serine/threonine-protein kinase